MYRTTLSIFSILPTYLPYLSNISTYPTLPYSILYPTQTCSTLSYLPYQKPTTLYPIYATLP